MPMQTCLLILHSCTDLHIVTDRHTVSVKRSKVMVQ